MKETSTISTLRKEPEPIPPCRSQCCTGDPKPSNRNSATISPVQHRLLHKEQTTHRTSPCRSQCCTGDPPAHQANLRKGRFSEKLGLYSITKCCAPGSQLTSDQKESILQTMLKTREQGHTLLHAFVVMPDHLHMLITLNSNRSLPNLMREFARQVRISATRTGTPIHWQKSFHDHKVRANEPVVDIVKYIENNPLRKHLAAAPSDWRWSSACAEWKPYLDREFLGHQRWEVRN